MRDFVLIQSLVNGTGGNIAITNDGSGQCRHGPRMAPAVTVKHGDGVKIARMLGQVPSDDGSHGHQITTAVVIDDTLWAATCATGIVQAQSLPFVGRQLPVKVGVTFSE